MPNQQQSENPSLISTLMLLGIAYLIWTSFGNGTNPSPIDPPKPDPTPVVGKLQVLIVEDPSLRADLPAEQIAIMEGADVRSYAKTHCSVTDGAPDFRVLSFRQDVSAEPEWIQAAMKERGETLPALIVSNGKSGTAMPLPKTIKETLAVLTKYGGE